MTRHALGRYLKTRPSPEQVDRSWRAIRDGLRRRSPSRAIAVAALAAALLVLVLLVPMPWRKTASIQGTVIETDAAHSQTVTLAEGSRVVLGPSSKLLLVDVSTQHVRLELERGTIDVDATHRAGRTFSVGARQLDIEVVGTRFHVEVGAGPSDVDVSVSRGRVRVLSRDDPGHPRYLAAGESWSTRAVVPTPPPSSQAVTAPAEHDAGVVHEAPPRPKLPAQFAGLYKEGRYVDAYALVEDDFEARCETVDADDLFMLATTARDSGHPRHAATAFDALRTRYRGNAHAPIAALELGRLDLDDLDDPKAAKSAFDDAIALQPDGFFREDADARRVQALDELGDHAGCVEARDRYLDTYPDGTHRATVARRCR